MKKYQIELSAEEAGLVNRITLDLVPLLGFHDKLREAHVTNQECVPALMKSLEERNAIPGERLKYWTDPKYTTDHRLKISRRGLFERNGCKGADIYRHVDFLPFLRYFLLGADLPEEAIAEFEKQAGNPDRFTSGDYEPLAKCARALIRRHSLKKSHAREEFFKLCLDIGLGVTRADTIFGWLR